jgi:hypothetical protein
MSTSLPFPLLFIVTLFLSTYPSNGRWWFRFPLYPAMVQWAFTEYYRNWLLLICGFHFLFFYNCSFSPFSFNTWKTVCFIYYCQDLNFNMARLWKDYLNGFETNALTKQLSISVYAWCDWCLM